MRYLCLFLALAVYPAAAGEVIPGPVPAQVIRVVDGDTIAVRARIWLHQDVESLVRLAGVDTPELHGPACEAALARAARDFVQSRLPDGAPISLHRIIADKYGNRVVAAVKMPDGRALSTLLLKAGLARPYDGRAKGGPWCYPQSR